MKIIHTADWHIGQHFYQYDRKEEHQYFLEWLKIQIENHQVDVLLIAGDVFDSPNPSAESQRMFYTFLYQVTIANPHLQIIVIAGNHDSAGRLEAPQSLLSSMQVEIRGLIQRNEDGEIDFNQLLIPLKQNGETKAWCLAVPFLRQGDYPESGEYGKGVSAMYSSLKEYAKRLNTKNLPLIAMGHLHVFGSQLSENDLSERVVVGGLEYVTADVFSSDFAYVGLGHLHKPQAVGEKENIRYAGSPLPMSFSEIFYKQGVDLVELDEKGLVGIQRLDFQPLATLLSIPEEPQILSQVLAELVDLPNGEISSSSPYLEIKVLETEPEPSKRHQIEEAVKGKAVRLARIAAVTPNNDNQREQQNITIEKWQNIHPLEIAQDVFRNRFHSEMPPHIENLLIEVIRETEGK